MGKTSKTTVDVSNNRWVEVEYYIDGRDEPATYLDPPEYKEAKITEVFYKGRPIKKLLSSDTISDLEFLVLQQDS